MSRLGAHFVVMGAGPAGAATAAYLARAGRDVLLIDAHDTPLESFGESLLPACTEVLNELGVSMDGFMVKHGAVFLQEGEVARFDFANAVDPTYTHAWQVQRRIFDANLRDAAKSSGASLLHARVTGIDLPARQLTTSEGVVSFEHLIDASGRSMLLAKHLGLRTTHPKLRNAAVGARYTGIDLSEVSVPGDVVLPVFNGGWFWFIPFADGTTSVGCVTTPGFRNDPAHKALGASAARLQTALDQCPDAARLLDGAVELAPPVGVADFTASATQLYGDGWSLVGDAASFVDPVFSSGVTLGLHSARWLADALLNDTRADYEKKVRGAVDVFTSAVLAFYDGTFLQVAYAPSSPASLSTEKVVISLLAGDVFGPNCKAPRRLARRFPDLAMRISPLPATSSAPSDTTTSL